MSKKHPIISVVGSSGAGTTFIKDVFEKIFEEKNIKPCVIEGDSFHKYERGEMKRKVVESRMTNRTLTHFSNKANHFDKLAELFDSYNKSGTGKRRYYIHSDRKAQQHSKAFGVELSPGQFTPWEDIGKDSDLMFYEGLHGGIEEVVNKVDLLIGVVPSINIEWMQKIYRDHHKRYYTPVNIHTTILERMPDYAEFMTPQFDRTHINFHRVPLIDTSNPFDVNKAKGVPLPEDSLVVTTVRIDNIDLEGIKNKLPEDAMAFLQNENTLVYKGNYMIGVLDLMLSPIIEKLIANK